MVETLALGFNHLLADKKVETLAREFNHLLAAKKVLGIILLLTHTMIHPFLLVTQLITRLDIDSCKTTTLKIPITLIGYCLTIDHQGLGH